MILLYNVVPILVLASLDRCLPLSGESIQRGQVRTAFFDCHRLGLAVVIDRLFGVAPRRGLATMGAQQEIDRVTFLVICAIQVLPMAADLTYVSSILICARIFQKLTASMREQEQMKIMA